jgi:hypothetical protein
MSLDKVPVGLRPRDIEASARYGINSGILRVVESRSRQLSALPLCKFYESVARLEVSGPITVIYNASDHSDTTHVRER